VYGEFMKRPKVGDILLHDNYAGVLRKEIVTDVVETDDAVTIKTEFIVVDKDRDYSHASKRSSKRAKYLCFGGPLDGKKMISDEANGYTMFNRSYKGGRRDPTPTAILVWEKSF
jgi:hypothetical protein